MFPDALLDYLDSRLAGIGVNYGQALNRHDPEAIHNLRVELKHLKALFELIGFLDENFSVKRRFRNFRLISRQTGRLRDLQVQKNLMLSFQHDLPDDLSGYTDFLKLKEAEAWENFLLFAQKDTLGKLGKSRVWIKETLAAVLPETALILARKFLAAQLEALQRFSRESRRSVRLLHKVRMLSKEAQFTFEIIQLAFPQFEARQDYISALKNVHQCLGKWHDLEVCLACLKDYRISCGGAPADSESCGRLVNQVSSGKRALRSEFRGWSAEFVGLPPFE